MKKLALLQLLFAAIALADITYWEAVVRPTGTPIPRTFKAKATTKIDAVSAALLRCESAGYFECKLVRVSQKTKKDGGWL